MSASGRVAHRHGNQCACQHNNRRYIVAAVVCALVCLSAPIGAQRSLGVIVGFVKDEAGVAIPYVEVVATRAVASIARTDSAGRFVLDKLPPGVQEISFRRVSFSPFITRIEVTAGDTTEVDVKLSANPIPIAAVIVKEDSAVSPRLIAFEAHRKAGSGHYITRTEIVHRQPLLLSDMVRMVPGTVLIPNGISGRASLRFSRARGCPPQYFIDGIFADGYSIDDMPVSDVEAVELYAGIAGLPPEFAKARGARECGTVAIWTRIPGKTDPPPDRS